MYKISFVLTLVGLVVKELEQLKKQKKSLFKLTLKEP